jgi:electron transfer flavoprotein beta subunit
MEIFVLLKQVPATESVVSIADDGVAINTDDLNWVINPYDEFAVEEALRIREAQGGTVTIVSVGPDKATEAIRTALAMGADKGILVNDPAALYLGGLGVARVLAAVIAKQPFDLIIGGLRAVDDDGWQVGPAVAELLDIPHIGLVIKQEITDGKMTCQRTVDGGTVTLAAPLPALFTTQRGLNEPRYASLPGVMKAKKKPLDTVSLADLGLDVAELGAVGTRITALGLPPQREAGKIIAGEDDRAKAAELVRLLHEEAKIL